MSWNAYLVIIFLMGLAFFASAIYGLMWASKKGQLKNFDKGSRVIFDEDEPEGVEQDNFPNRKKMKDADGKTRVIQPEREGTSL